MQSKLLELYESTLPSKAFCCDHFNESKARFLKDALKKKHIQHNNFNSVSWLVFDIDRATCPDSLRNDLLAPEPTIFVSNRQNRHAHVLYLLKTPVHKNPQSSVKALKYLASIEQGLMLQLGSDVNYSGFLSKNATHPFHQVLPTFGGAYSLDELADFINFKELNSTVANVSEFGLGRNVKLFESLREWSYKAIRQGWPSFEQFRAATLQRAEMINTQFNQKLHFNEVKSVAHSVSKYTHAKFSAQGFSEWQSERGKLGGRPKTTTAQGKPWEALGVSRATWYRQQKNK